MGCHNKVPQTGWLQPQNTYFPTDLEAGKSKIKVLANGGLVAETSQDGEKAVSLPILTEAAALSAQGPTPVTPLSLYPLLPGPISKLQFH